MGVKVDAVICDIRFELNRAKQKFPVAKRTLAAIMEEVGELSEALLKIQEEGGREHTCVYKEAIQVAVTAIRLASEGDTTFPNYDPESGYRGKNWVGYKHNVKPENKTDAPSNS